MLVEADTPPRGGDPMFRQVGAGRVAQRGKLVRVERPRLVQHPVSDGLDAPGPVAAWTSDALSRSLDAGETGRQLLEEAQHLAPPELIADDRLAPVVDIVNLEGGRRDIRTGRANLQVDGSPFKWSKTATTWHLNAVWSAVHGIKLAVEPTSPTKSTASAGFRR